MSTWQIPNRFAAAGRITFGNPPSISRGVNLSSVVRDAAGDYRVILTQKLPPDAGLIRGAVAFLRPCTVTGNAARVPTQVVTSINADGDIRALFLDAAAAAGVDPSVAYSLIAVLTPAGTGA